MKTACGAGDSIKPGVKSSGTPGLESTIIRARESGRQSGVAGKHWDPDAHVLEFASPADTAA
jgi:hypothetical protein